VSVEGDELLDAGRPVRVAHRERQQPRNEGAVVASDRAAESSEEPDRELISGIVPKP
jgi:hypothetical protein